MKRSGDDRGWPLLPHQQQMLDEYRCCELERLDEQRRREARARRQTTWLVLGLLAFWSALVMLGLWLAGRGE